MGSRNSLKRYAERSRATVVGDAIAIIIVTAIVSLSFILLTGLGLEVEVKVDSQLAQQQDASRKRLEQVEQIDQEVRQLNIQVQRENVLEQLREMKK